MALALALGTRAPLLLLDEPLASLDPLARRDFLNLLSRELRARRATAVFSSHLVSDVEHACDHLVVLASGHLALSMSLAEAKLRFRTWDTDERQPDAIGVFAEPDGMPRTLATGIGGRPATVEEIVIGHLAAARQVRP